jgi:hypothetical protein
VIDLGKQRSRRKKKEIVNKLNPICSYQTGTSSTPFCNEYETMKETLIKKRLKTSLFLP